MNTGIYEIVNTANGKRYVGSAVNFCRRWKGHLRSCLNGSHHSRHLQRAWAKYGENAFEFRKLLICSKPNLLMYEQRAIDALKPEYNIAQRAGNTLGVKPTAEKIAKLSAANMGHKPSDETRAKLSAVRLGKPHPLSLEGRARLIHAIKSMNRDYMRTEEYREAVSQRSRGKSVGKGRKHSDETKAKMAATRRGRVSTMLGRKHSDEARAKMSAARRGVPLKPEHAAKIAAALKGKPKSAEHRKKVAEANARRFAL